MSLYKAHISDSNIKIVRIWRSDAFLIYLQGQLATFTKYVFKAMAAVLFSHTRC